MYLEREIDAVFAALNIFSYGGDSEGHNKIINAVGKEIDNKKLWNEITSPYIKSEMLKALEKLSDAKGRGWLKTLKKKTSLEKKATTNPIRINIISVLHIFC